MTRSVPTVRRHSFADVSHLTPQSSGHFEANINAEWTLGGKPNGGYLPAMLGRAATSESDHRHVITASAQYLHTPNPGPVTLEADTRRAGRSTSHVHARMRQDGQVCVEALLTTSQLDRATEPFWDQGLPEMGGVGFEECTRLTPRTPDGKRVAIMDQVEVRLETGSNGFTRSQPSGRGELRGWLALPGDEIFDATSLLFAVDAFPPATFDIEFAGWVPTLQLTVYVRALPVPGPVRVLQRARLIDAQRVDEVCFIWDRTGRLVAQSSQLAGIRLG